MKLELRSLNRRGMALMLCLLMISTLCLIGGAALSVSGLNRKIVHNATKKIQAFYIAEAGRETALAGLKQNPLWRGDGETSPSSFQGESVVGNAQGIYIGKLSDCTDDENGLYNALLPAGHVMVTCRGTYLDAIQEVSCLVSMTPGGMDPATFPQKALISSGDVTGSIVTLNNFGTENSSLILSGTTLPEANQAALKSFSDHFFLSLDNKSYDDTLNGISSFWRDSPVDTRPNITYVQGDLEISGDRQLFGIIFVEGDRVELSGQVCIHGILYAPHASTITIVNTGDSGHLIGIGQFATGPGGLQVVGNEVAFQLCHEYVDSFNDMAGTDINTSMVSGSWRPF